MKILVTGGAGFIGRNLTKSLRILGHRVLVLDKQLPNRYNPFGRNDLLDIRNNWLDFGDSEPYDVVFHLGAYVSATKSVLEPGECYQNNVGGTLNILNEINFKRIVFTSTAALYGWIANIPKDLEPPKQSEAFDTSLISDLLSPYSKSKMMGEEIIKDSTESYAILRPFNVYGKHQNPEYGAVIQSFLRNYENKEEYIIYGDGEQIRDFVHVDDVTDALIFAGLCEQNFTANVGTGVGVSLNNLQKMFDSAGSVVYKDKREGDPYYSVADTKVLRELGWSSKIKLEEGLERLKND